MAVHLKLTAAEFLELPETVTPIMLLDGEVIEMPSPEVLHQRALRKLVNALERVIQGGELFFAPLDVHLDDGNVVQPDLLWIAQDSQTCTVAGKILRGAPDFVVEVLSPGTARFDRKAKFDLYERYGTREYWLLDPAELYIEVYVRIDQRLQRLDVFSPDETIPSPLLGNIQLAAVFQS